ncbi:DUF2934 domain-containing protein [Reyranella sp. CPCC 100927]|uniref:DUF2934 domain-containing protein n=1 Tax=Reyranella sp. CPCC 100927 TaxID=2599616 RepID=UPI0011B612C9|nr:DUF2934 domain-containing protein [Reyranella sp. CPCC 100927]TWS97336.1 DUF2934 domain-containing protein [Reyranella sp. CPCC 100927]
MVDREERIRQRAHEIWEMEGRPDGRDQEHWERAHREIDAKQGETPSGQANEPRSPDDPTAGKPQPRQTAPASPSRAKR